MDCQQRFEFHALLAGARVGMENSDGRAHRRAGAATDAEVGIDDDLLATLLAVDGFCQADVDAGTAANFFIAAVGANFFLVVEELWLFELANQ